MTKYKTQYVLLLGIKIYIYISGPNSGLNQTLYNCKRFLSKGDLEIIKGTHKMV